MRTLKYISQTSGYTLIINKLSIAFIKMVSKWSGVQFFFFFPLLLADICLIIVLPVVMTLLMACATGSILNYHCSVRRRPEPPLLSLLHMWLHHLHATTSSCSSQKELLATLAIPTTIQRPPLARNTHAVLLPRNRIERP